MSSDAPNEFPQKKCSPTFGPETNLLCRLSLIMGRRGAWSKRGQGGERYGILRDDDMHDVPPCGWAFKYIVVVGMCFAASIGISGFYQPSTATTAILPTTTSTTLALTPDEDERRMVAVDEQDRHAATEQPAPTHPTIATTPAPSAATIPSALSEITAISATVTSTTSVSPTTIPTGWHLEARGGRVGALLKTATAIPTPAIVDKLPIWLTGEFHKENDVGRLVVTITSPPNQQLKFKNKAPVPLRAVPGSPKCFDVTWHYGETRFCQDEELAVLLELEDTNRIRWIRPRVAAPGAPTAATTSSHPDSSSSALSPSATNELLANRSRAFDRRDAGAKPTCALVLGGWSVMPFRRGREIDAHNWIFRCNDGVGSNFDLWNHAYGDFVGRRTTHYFLWKKHLRKVSAAPPGVISVFPGTNAIEVKSFYENDAMFASQGREVLLMDASYRHKCRELHRLTDNRLCSGLKDLRSELGYNCLCSTGAMAITWGLSLCSQSRCLWLYIQTLYTFAFLRQITLIRSTSCGLQATRLQLRSKPQSPSRGYCFSRGGQWCVQGHYEYTFLVP